MYTLPPFFKYSAATSAVRCQQTMLCQSVRSFHSPLCLSLKLSLVAMLNLVTAVPCGVYLSSGSLPSVPIRMTLLTLFAMGEGSPLLGLCDAQYIRGAGRAESRECGIVNCGTSGRA